MLAANLVRAGLLAALVLATLSSATSIWLLYVVAFGAGTAETCYDTAAQAIVPQLVAPERLSRANGRLYAAELTANELVGPPLAGFLVAAGVLTVVVAPALLWLLAVAALLFVRGAFRVDAGKPRVAEGLRFVWRHRVLRTFTVVVGVFNFASSGTQAILVLYVVGPGSVLGLDERAYGWLVTAPAMRQPARCGLGRTRGTPFRPCPSVARLLRLRRGHARRARVRARSLRDRRGVLPLWRNADHRQRRHRLAAADPRARGVAGARRQLAPARRLRDQTPGRARGRCAGTGARVARHLRRAGVARPRRLGAAPAAARGRTPQPTSSFAAPRRRTPSSSGVHRTPPWPRRALNAPGARTASIHAHG